MIEPEAMPSYVGRTPEGVLFVLGNEGHWDGRHFELTPNGHGTEVHMVGQDKDTLIATYQSYATARMAYDIASTKDTKVDVITALEKVSEDCYIQPGNWVVYVLHFDRKIGTARGDKDYAPHARHYVGCTNDINRRMNEHLSVPSKASPLVQALIKQGGCFQIAQLQSYGTDMNMAFGQESYLKSLKSTPRFCAICTEEKK